MLVISNTSPLLYLHRTGNLDLLRRLYGRVHLPPAVRSELAAGAASPRLSPICVLRDCGSAKSWPPTSLRRREKGRCLDCVRARATAG